MDWIGINGMEWNDARDPSSATMVGSSSPEFATNAPTRKCITLYTLASVTYG
jgi:hypothetical protein